MNKPYSFPIQPQFLYANPRPFFILTNLLIQPNKSHYINFPTYPSLERNFSVLSGYHVVPARCIRAVHFGFGRLGFGDGKRRESVRVRGERLLKSDSFNTLLDCSNVPARAPHQLGDMVPTRHWKFSPHSRFTTIQRHVRLLDIQTVSLFLAKTCLAHALSLLDLSDAVLFALVPKCWIQ